MVFSLLVMLSITEIPVLIGFLSTIKQVFIILLREVLYAHNIHSHEY